MVIGGINLGLLILLAVLVLPHVSSAHPAGASTWRRPTSAFDPGLLGLIFGVILAAYFGHFSTGTCARLVLSRDPSGRSLVLGNVAAMCVAIVLNCLWVVAVNGTLAPACCWGSRDRYQAPRRGGRTPGQRDWRSVRDPRDGDGRVHAALGVMYQLREWLATDAAPVNVEAPRGGALASAVTRLRRSRFALGAVPIVLIFGLAAWLAAQGVSFAGPIGVLGVLAYSVLGGILPTLVLFAAGARASVPGSCLADGRASRRPRRVYLLFSASFFVHGLVIWEEPVQRLAAVGVGGALLSLTVLVIRRGGFMPRAVVEVAHRPRNGPSRWNDGERAR